MIRSVLLAMVLMLSGANGDFSSSATAQVTDSTTLTVQVATRAAVALPGMSVQVTDSSGNVLAAQVSNNQGLVFFSDLPPSCVCVLEVSATGRVLARVRFETSKRRALRIEI